MELDFEKAMAMSIPNEIWYHISVAEWVLSNDPSKLLGYRPVDIDKAFKNEELPS